SIEENADFRLASVQTSVENRMATTKTSEQEPSRTASPRQDRAKQAIFRGSMCSAALFHSVFHRCGKLGRNPNQPCHIPDAFAEGRRTVTQAARVDTGS